MGFVLFGINSIALFVPAMTIAQQRFPRQILKAIVLAFTIFLCSLTAIELILGGVSLLNNVTLSLSAIFVGLLQTFLGWKYPWRTDPPNNEMDLNNLTLKETEPLETVELQKVEADTLISSSSMVLNQRGILALAFITTVLSIPTQGFWIEYLFQIHRIHPLTSWDVVTYHLPNAIDYLQSGSLWTIRGPFSQYPGGNELINIWSFLPLKTDAFLGLNSLAFNSITSLVLLLCLQSLNVFKMPFLYWLSFVSIWIVLFFQPDYQITSFALGQNDLPLAMVELLALWVLIQALETPDLNRYWVLLGAVLGIGIGIKPNGLYYCLGFVILTLYALHKKNRFKLINIIQKLVYISIFSALFGGFWYARNWIVLGQLFQNSILEAGFSGAIVNNLFNPKLYVLDETNLIIFTILGITLLGFIFLLGSKPLQQTPFDLLLGFNVIAFFGFIVTPHSAGFWAGSQWVFKTQLRYGITLVPLTIVVAIVILATGLSWISPPSLQSRWHQVLTSLHRSSHQDRANINTTNINTISPISFPLLKVYISILVLCGLQYLTYHPPVGLPNFDPILFVRDRNSLSSKVYIWVQENITDKTIYTIGLRPYGLYNIPFSNRVIYGGDSDQWTYEEALKVLQTDKPDFLALSRNPFNGVFPTALPELLNHSDRFTLVYGDPLAVVFKVQ